MRGAAASGVRGAAASGCNEATVVVGATARCLSAAAGAAAVGKRVASTSARLCMGHETEREQSDGSGRDAPLRVVCEGLLLLIFGCDGERSFFCGL